MGGCMYFLDRMNAYHTILHSPDVSHQWFKVGLSASIGECFDKISCTFL